MNGFNMKIGEALMMELATRQRVATTVTVESALRNVRKLVPEAKRGDIVDCFGVFERDNLGRFFCGRRGWPSRFVWNKGQSASAYAFYFPVAA